MHRFLVQIDVCYTVHRLMIGLGVIELNIAPLSDLQKIEYVYTDVYTITSSRFECEECEIQRFLVQIAVCYTVNRLMIGLGRIQLIVLLAGLPKI